MRKLTITKENGIWKGAFLESKVNSVSKRKCFLKIDEVKANSFGELMFEIGEKNWVDKINKNEQNESGEN